MSKNTEYEQHINIDLSSEGIVVSLKNGSFSKKIRNKICDAFIDILKRFPSSESCQGSEISTLEKAMQVEVYTEDGDYFGDVDWDLSVEDERKLKMFSEAAAVAADYNIYVQNEKINALDDTDEAKKLFDGFEREWFAPLFVKCNGQSFKTFEEARQKAEEIHDNLTYRLK